MHGFFNIKPIITHINVENPDYLVLSFADGRILSTPVLYFPSIHNLTPEERQNWSVLDGQMFTFMDCDEVFHIEQLLGKEQIYEYHFVAPSERGA